MSQAENSNLVPEDKNTVWVVPGLGEVHEGDIVSMAPHPVLNIFGQAVVDAEGNIIMCSQSKGRVGIQKPLIGNPYISVVCNSNRNPH